MKRIEIGDSTDEGSALSKVLSVSRDIFRLIKLVRNERPSVVHVNPSLLPTALVRDCILIAALHAIGYRNILSFLHGWNDDVECKLQSSALLRRAFIQTLGRSKAIIVLASRFRDSLVDLGIAADRIHIFSTMFDESQFDNLTSRRAANTTQLLFLGRLIREKGVLECLEAFAKVVKTYPQLRMKIAGSGPVSDEIANRIVDLGVSDKVQMTGFVTGEKKSQLLLDSDIFLLPTRHGEGCPVALLEAMAAGLLVIASDVGGIRDVMQDGCNGILLQGDDPECIADAIDRAVRAPEWTAKIMENNVWQARNSYKSEVVTRRLELLYDRVSAEP